MNRRLTTMMTGVAAGVVLLCATARAADPTTTTTTTPTTTTTTTTLLPHPYSDATRSCVELANAARKSCTGATCVTDYETAFSKCFLPPAGVKCAKSCIGKEDTCFVAVPKTRRTCRKACGVTNRKDIRACRRIADGGNLWGGGDASCLTTAAANLDLCRYVCSEAKTDCRTNFKFCIADCPNL